MDIYDFDTALMRRWYDTMMRVTGGAVPRYCNMHYVIHRGRNFDNLIEWCRWVLEDEHDLAPSIKSANGTNLMAAKVALDLAIISRGRSWESCKRSLEGLRTLCGLLKCEVEGVSGQCWVRVDTRRCVHVRLQHSSDGKMRIAHRSLASQHESELARQTGVSLGIHRK